MKYLGTIVDIDGNITIQYDNFEKIEFVAYQGQQTFTFSKIYEIDKILLYVNGFLIPEDEYSIASFTDYFTVTLDEGLNVSDRLTLVFFGVYNSTDIEKAIIGYNQEFFLTSSAVNTFSVSYSTDITGYNNDVYINGLRIPTVDYNISGNSFTILRDYYLQANTTVTIESFVSESVHPSGHRINVAPIGVGTSGVPVARVSGGNLEIRKITNTQNIRCDLNHNDELELRFNHNLFKVENISPNGVDTTFSLTNDPYSSYSSLVSIDGILQVPETNYSIDPIAKTIEFGSVPDSSSLISIIHLSTLANTQNLVTVSDNTVSTSKIVNGAVTVEKLEKNYLHKIGNFNSFSGYKYIANTENADIITLLPTIRSSGDSISFTKMSANNSSILIPAVVNSDRIENKLFLELTADNTHVDIVYDGEQWITTTKNIGWQYINQSVMIFNFGNFLADTSAGQITVELPLNPIYGETLTFFDYGSTWDVNNLFIDGNNYNIGASTTYACNVKDSTVSFLFVGTSWKALT